MSWHCTAFRGVPPRICLASRSGRSQIHPHRVTFRLSPDPSRGSSSQICPQGALKDRATDDRLHRATRSGCHRAKGYATLISSCMPLPRALSLTPAGAWSEDGLVLFRAANSGRHNREYYPKGQRFCRYGRQMSSGARRPQHPLSVSGFARATVAGASRLSCLSYGPPGPGRGQARAPLSCADRARASAGRAGG